MARTIHKTEEAVPTVGYQAVLSPSKFGYSLAVAIPDEMLEALEVDREESLNWAKSKLKNPRRSVLKPEPWEEIADGLYKIKFSWKEETKPPIVDTEGSPVTDPKIPIYEGSRVKVAFYQKPYILRDGETYGTSLKLVGVQIVSIQSGAGVDAGDLGVEDVASLFGTTKGFKAGDPNITPAGETSNEVEDDF